MWKAGVIIIFILTLTMSSVSAAVTDDWGQILTEQRLLHDLLAQQSPLVRPSRNASTPVNVQLGIALIRMDDLDEVHHKLITHTWLRMMWPDIRLKWNPEEYDNIDIMRVPIDRIWSPDITLYNSAYEVFAYSDMKPMAVVYSDGSVLFIPKVRLESTCHLNLRHFPFDTQRCSMKFGSWVYSDSQVNLSLFERMEKVDVSDYIEHHAWEITGNKLKVNQKYYPCCAEGFPDITATLDLKRRSAFYTHLLITPWVLLMLLLPTIFLVPSGNNEKIILGVCVVLGHVLLIIVLIEMLPGAHFSVPVIGIDFLVGLALSVLSLVCAILVNKVWNNSRWQKPVPSWIRMILHNICGRVCCVDHNRFVTVGDVQPVSMRQLTDRAPSVGTEDDQIQIIQAESQLATSSEWRQLAVILDRLFFFSFLGVIIITAIIGMSGIN